MSEFHMVKSFALMACSILGLAGTSFAQTKDYTLGIVGGSYLGTFSNTGGLNNGQYATVVDQSRGQLVVDWPIAYFRSDDGQLVWMTGALYDPVEAATLADMLSSTFTQRND